jgi:hypothetical protein
MGWRDCSITSTNVVSAVGQVDGAPSGVVCQSNAHMR